MKKQEAVNALETLHRFFESLADSDKTIFNIISTCTKYKNRNAEEIKRFFQVNNQNIHNKHV